MQPHCQRCGVEIAHGYCADCGDRAAQVLAGLKEILSQKVASYSGSPQSFASSAKLSAYVGIQETIKGLEGGYDVSVEIRRSLRRSLEEIDKYVRLSK